ncbi:head GIN domain-containing protein [Fluviicola taffensis]|uniref:head GIN domain-containing protein n=1 Tax=Fluviicola taffensis TaxID=191579 RepID=UPI0031381627
MTEDKLNGLFDEIRNESAQTSISEVDQWIDAAAAAAVTVGLLATLKLILIKKPLIMWTTLLTITGTASLGVALIFNQPEVKEKPEKKEVVSYSVPANTPDNYREKEEKIDEPTDTESPILEEPITEPNSEKPNLPEDLGALIPLKTIKSDRQERIPVYRSYRVQTGESFTKIHVSGALYVELSQGNSCSVQIEPESAKDLVEVEIQNGTLYLKNAFNKKERKEKVVIKVSVQDLKELHMSGATSLISINQLGVETLTLEADGASNVNLSLKATKLNGDFSGASDVEIAGTCDVMDLDVSGASEAKLADLSVRKVILDNSGAAQVNLLISEELKADGSGASTTYYKIASGSKSIRVDANTTGSAVIKDRKN